MATQAFIPPVVQKLLDDLHAATGCAADLSRLGRLWCIALASERSRLTINVKITGLDEYRMVSSVFEVDGKPRPAASDMNELVAGFCDPDRAPSSVVVEPAPSVCPVDEAPPKIRHIYLQIMKALSRVPEAANANVYVAKISDGWIVGVEIDAGAGIVRMKFRRQNNSWRPDHKCPFQVVVHGADFSAGVKSLAGAIKVMVLGLSKRETSVQPTIGSPAASARSNSVEARRSSVRRI